MSYQTLIIVGNVGREPVMRFTPGGQPVTDFSVAVNREYTKDSGEKAKETTWFKVSIWGKQAETCNTYVKKGMLVLVEGRLTADEGGNPRVYTRQDGTPAASFEVTAQTVRFLDKPAEPEVTF